MPKQPYTTTLSEVMQGSTVEASKPTELERISTSLTKLAARLAKLTKPETPQRKNAPAKITSGVIHKKVRTPGTPAIVAVMGPEGRVVKAEGDVQVTRARGGQRKKVSIKEPDVKPEVKDDPSFSE